MYKVIIADREGRSSVFALTADEISVGGDDTNAICLIDPAVASRHARLLRRDGGYVVENLSAGLGTKLNAVLVAGTPALKNGDELVIGSHRLSVVEEKTAVEELPVTRTALIPRGGWVSLAGKLLLSGAGVAAVVVSGYYLTSSEEPRITLPPVWRAVDPAAPVVVRRVRPADSEQQNAAALQALEQAFAQREYAAVLASAGSVGDKSMHHARASELVTEARAQLIAQHLILGGQRRAHGHCAEARKEAEAALALDESNRAARQLLARCGRSTALALSPRAAARVSAATAPASGDTPKLETAPPARRPIEAANPYAADLPP